jgi:hypothetical protein
MTRLQICKQCTHHDKIGRLVSCGTFLVGGTGVEIINGKAESISLCGCIMNIKVKLKSSKCPANKW